MRTITEIKKIIKKKGYFTALFGDYELHLTCESDVIVIDTCHHGTRGHYVTPTLTISPRGEITSRFTTDEDEDEFEFSLKEETHPSEFVPVFETDWGKDYSHSDAEKVKEWVLALAELYRQYMAVPGHD